MKLWTFILATALSLCAFSCPLQAENYVSRKYAEFKASPSETILAQQEAKKLSTRLRSNIENEKQLTYDEALKLYRAGITDSSIRKYLSDTETKLDLKEKQIEKLKIYGASQKTIDALKPTKAKKAKSKN